MNVHKLVIGLFVIFCFSFSLVNADVFEPPETSTNISIEGCSIAGGDDLEIGECSSDGAWFCAGHENLQSTFTDPDACTLGQGTIVGGNVCCPGGTHSCREATVDDGGSYIPTEYYCFAATQDCSDYETLDECDDDDFHGGQCYWYTSGGECVPRRDQCYDYGSQAECNNDDQEVGGKDVNCRHGEYMINGILYTIEDESCACAWDAGSGKCGLDYSLTRTYGDGTDLTTCRYELTQGTECINGVIDYVYNALNFNPDPTHTGIQPGDALCFDRPGKRACGEPVIKVPFFSFFNVVIVVGLIVLFYFSQTKFAHKKKK